MLHMFYRTVVAGSLFYAAVSWGGSLRDESTEQLDKLVKKASSVLGRRLGSLKAVVERVTMNKLNSVLDNSRHPVHSLLVRQKSPLMMLQK